MELVTKFEPASDAPGDASDLANDLVGFVRQQLEDMNTYRMQIMYTQRLGACLEAREGKYPVADLVDIKKFGGTDVFARLTTNKVRGAAAMLRATFIQNERPWEIEPTPVPTLPEDISQSVAALVKSEADAMAQAGQPVPPGQMKTRIEELVAAANDVAVAKATDQASVATRYIDDILTEGGFYEALNSCLLDFCTLPLAVLCGPTAVMRTQVRYENGKPVKKYGPVLRYRRVDPYDVMWTPGAPSIDVADVIERIRMQRSDLQKLIGLDGYDEDAVRSCLREYGTNGFYEPSFHDQTRDDIQNRESMLHQRGNIDVLAYSGAIPGRLLIEYGIAQTVDGPVDEDFDYLAQIWMCNRYVLKAQIDPDPRERHSYYSAAYEPVPGSVVGTALPELIADIQATYNATLRALINNLGMASGPQVSVNLDRIPPGTDIANLQPWKIWPFLSDPMANTADKPIDFFQPNIMATELMGVLSFLQGLADEVSAIPRYMTGSDKVGGAGRTASGLSMLMSNATRTMTSVAASIDGNILTPAIQKTYDLVMLTTGTEVLRGDESIVPRGATFAEKRETDRMRMLEFLQITANPIDMNIIGDNGRAEMLREVSETFINGKKVVPSEQQLAAKQRQQQAAMAAQQAQAALQGAQNPQEQAPAPGGAPSAPGGGASMGNKPKAGKTKTAPNAVAAPTDNMQRTRAA